MTGETPEVRSDKRRRKLFYVVKGLVQNSAHRLSEAQCKSGLLAHDLNWFRKELLFCFLFCTAVAYFTINYSSELSVAHYSSLHHHPLLSIHQGCTLASAPKTLFSSKILFPPLLFLLLLPSLGGRGSVVKEKRDLKVRGKAGCNTAKTTELLYSSASSTIAYSPLLYSGSANSRVLVIRFPHYRRHKGGERSSSHAALPHCPQPNFTQLSTFYFATSLHSIFTLSVPPSLSFSSFSPPAPF